MTRYRRLIDTAVPHDRWRIQASLRQSGIDPHVEHHRQPSEFWRIEVAKSDLDRGRDVLCELGLSNQKRLELSDEANDGNVRRVRKRKTEK